MIKIARQTKFKKNKNGKKLIKLTFLK